MTIARTASDPWLGFRRVSFHRFVLALVLSASTSLFGGLSAIRSSIGGDLSSGCGCELSEPTCAAPACDKSCDGIGPCTSCRCRASSSCGRVGLPGLGEGLLENLDRMTDRFENSFLRFAGHHSNQRSCKSVCSCSSACSPSCGMELGGMESSGFSGFEETSDPMPGYQDAMPPTPIPLEAPMMNQETFTPSDEINSAPSSVPAPPEVNHPIPAKKMLPLPKVEALGDPFIDEARSKPRRISPTVHVAKSQTSVRGTTRNRYVPPAYGPEREAIEPLDPSRSEVITAGALQSTRKNANLYAR